MWIGAIEVCMNAGNERFMLFLAAAMFLAGFWVIAAGLLFRRAVGFWFAASASAITVLLFPLGTILAIATVAVISRRGVQATFLLPNAKRRPPAATAE